jgi:MFS family permease
MRNRGWALGINGMAGNLGLVSAPFLAGLLNWLMGWQWTFLLVGIVSILCGIITALVKIDETPLQSTVTKPDSTQSNGNGHYIKYFVILCAAMTLAGFAYRLNNIILPAYLELKSSFLWNFLKEFDLSNLQGVKTMAATLLVSLVYIISTIGQLVAGKLADKYDLRWLYLGFHTVSIPFVILMGIVDEQLLVICAALYVFFALGMQPIENSLVAKYTPKRLRSTSYGIKFILTFGISSTAVYAVSWIKKAYNLETVYFVAGTVIVALVFLVLFLIWSSRGTTCKNSD